MERLVTAYEMQQFDTYTINKVGLPALVLMERAALACIAQLELQSVNLSKVAVCCGYGNNGGDGIAIARLLKLKNIDVTLYLVGDSTRSTAEVAKQLNIAHAYQVPIITTLPSDLSQYGVLIDALFGVGLSRDIGGDFSAIIHMINQSGAYVMAVDMPSGITADTGQILGIAVKADMTVALAYKKLGLVLYPGAQYAGKVMLADIGIYANQPPVSYYSYSPSDLAEKLPKRADYANKGTFGKVLVIAGSSHISGAAYFSAKAAYRTGSGLVHIYTPHANRDILSTQLPEALITTYQPDHIDESKLSELIQWASVIVVGPGMGMSVTALQILTQVLVSAHQPIVIDADGLNMLAQDLSLLNKHRCSVFVTPHLGEMARLLNTDISVIASHLITSAKQFSQQYQVTCILKDTRTVITMANSNATYINQSGNNGMATGGSGDVLTGILAGLIAQGIALDIAAPVSVYLHGLAGDNAAKKNGQYAMLASDIIDHLSDVMTQYT